LSAAGKRPSGTVVGFGLSVRPARHGIDGPPMCSMATHAANVHTSALLILYLAATGAKKSRAPARPALAPQFASGA